MQNCLVTDSLTTTSSSSRLVFNQKVMYLEELSCYLDNTRRCCLGNHQPWFLIVYGETTDRVDCAIGPVCGYTMY